MSIGTFSPATVNVPGVGSGAAANLVLAGDGPTTIVNNDTANTIYLGGDSGVNPLRANVVPLPPQASTTVDGADDVYAVCLTGVKAQALTFPGTVPWNNPVGVQIALNALGLAKESTQQIVKTNTDNTHTAVVGVNTTLGVPAQDPSVTALPAGIFGTGVPIYTKSQLVKNQAAVSQAPGTINLSATFPVSQIGYEIFLTIFATGNFLSFYHLGLQWFDSSTGIQTAQEDYWFVPGTGSGINAHTIIGRGPTKGDQLVIVSEVPATSSVNVSHAYVVLQNSRLYQDDFFYTQQFISAGVVGTSQDATAGQIGASSFSVGASTTTTRLLPFYYGIASLWASTGSGGADLDIQVLNFADQSLTTPAAPVEFEQQTNAKGFTFAEQVPLPAGQCQVAVTNNNASGRTIQFSVVAAKQR